MRKIIIGVLIIVNFCFVLTGCNSTKVSPGGTKQIAIPTDNANPGGNSGDASALNKTGQETDLGSFYIGPQKEEVQLFVYSGEAVHVPYKVEGMSETKSDFGLILFVDGYPQSFKIRKSNGETSSESFMHKFSLNNHQTELFDVVFTPVAGKQGEKVGLVFAAIFKPDFIPESKNNPNYGNFHSVNAPFPQNLYFEKTVPEHGGKTFVKFKEENISQDIIDSYTRHGSRTSRLDEAVYTALLTDDSDNDMSKNNVFQSVNKKIKYRFRIMGGPSGITYRTVIYVNHKPIKIMNFDYLQTTLKKGKMYTAEFELDTNGYDQLSTIYAITNPIGKDYLSKVLFPIKTRSSLIVSELK